MIAVTKHKNRPTQSRRSRRKDWSKIESTFKRNEASIEVFLNRKGRFILATNDLDDKNFSDQHILEEYKQQQNVERGISIFKRSLVHGRFCF